MRAAVTLRCWRLDGGTDTIPAEEGEWGASLDRSCAARSLAPALRAVWVPPFAPAMDFIAPGIYKPDHGRSIQVLDLHHHAGNLLFVIETGDSWPYATLGQGIGFSPCGIAFVGPMAARLAALSVHGDFFGVAEDSAVHAQTIRLRRWSGTVSRGPPLLARRPTTRCRTGASSSGGPGRAGSCAQACTRACQSSRSRPGGYGRSTPG
jgi:hypothetical protein